MCRILFYLIVFCLSPATFRSCENPPEDRSLFLWSIRGPSGRQRSFLFGTIHVGYDQVWSSVSSKLKELIDRVDTLVLELALYDPLIVEKLIACKQLNSNQTLHQLLPTSLFRRLKKYFDSLRQLKPTSLNATLVDELRSSQQLNSLLNAWESRRPVWLLFLLYQLGEEQLKQSNVPMLDAYLAQKSQQLHKQLLSIETPDEQCNPLISINQEQITFAINYTLSFLEWSRRNPHRLVTKKSTIKDLIQLYRCGNLQVTQLEGWRLHESGFSLNPDLDEQAKRVDEQLKHDIIDQRNSRMAMRAHDLMKANPQSSFLFALGAGHFYGEYSLLNILNNYGYVVDPINQTTNIDEFFLGRSSFKNFNELWIRRNDPLRYQEQTTPLSGSDDSSRRLHYVFVLLFTIIFFIVLIHKLSQCLLRVMIAPKLSAYNQVTALPDYL